jgi:hypothetical protein
MAPQGRSAALASHPDTPLEGEGGHHAYDANAAPWWLRALWLAFFAFAFTYLMVNLFAAGVIDSIDPRRAGTAALPLGRRPVRATVDGAALVCYCYGCVLAHRVTRASGEAEGPRRGHLRATRLGIFFAVNVMMVSMPAYTCPAMSAPRAARSTARCSSYARARDRLDGAGARAARWPRSCERVGRACGGAPRTPTR